MPNFDLKKTKITEIKEKIEGASSIVLVDYRGLSVEEDTALRKELREANVEYKVFKNTMMNFAFEGTQFDALKKHLEGPSAIAISYADATAGPRVLEASTKKYKKLEFKAGVVEGVYYDAEGIKVVATIPTREVLLSKLLGSMKSPISAFARTIKAVAEKVEETGAATAAGIGAGKIETAQAAEVKAEVVEEVKVEEVKAEVVEEVKEVATDVVEDTTEA
ncbi:MAG: 50S ribosomal protein L10 [Firmicutes bacterium HGW-Firmicutes-1]|nr:MAG: 50S ribosomal protein L10 [Firmicutes bacterium HGW-Firmicutes-1]